MRLGSNIVACHWRAGAQCTCSAAEASGEISTPPPDRPTLDGFDCGFAAKAPHYDRNRRELWVGPFMVLSFAREAWNQIAVLEAFESLGWPPLIESPLGKYFDAKSVVRLWKTVFRLNQGQRPWLARFRSRATERTISWEFAVPGIPLKGS